MTRRDETLADDLDVRPGGVRTRVALLLRGAEPNPALCRPVLLKNTPSFGWEFDEDRRVPSRGGGLRGGYSSTVAAVPPPWRMTFAKYRIFGVFTRAVPPPCPFASAKSAACLPLESLYIHLGGGDDDVRRDLAIAVRDYNAEEYSDAEISLLSLYTCSEDAIRIQK